MSALEVITGVCVIVTCGCAFTAMVWAKEISVYVHKEIKYRGDLRKLEFEKSEMKLKMEIEELKAKECATDS